MSNYSTYNRLLLAEMRSQEWQSVMKIMLDMSNWPATVQAVQGGESVFEHLISSK